jgi:hypothetical protein
VASTPIALGSCTVSVRDPAQTVPRGRLQFDVRTYPYGALAAFCDVDSCILGPDGEPLRGLGVDLYGVDQTEPSATPPSGYANPLGITSSNELFVDLPVQYEPTCSTLTVGGQFTATAGNLGAALTQCVSNTSGRPARLRRVLTVTNASIQDPPGTPGTLNISVDTGSGDGTIDCGDIETCVGRADAQYVLDVDGTGYQIVRARSGQASAYSGSIRLPDVQLAAAATYTTTVQPELEILSAASAAFLTNGGVVELCSTLVPSPPSTDPLTTPTC